ncbi:MAG: hypothetical protein OHK0024_09360 [Thalassobaculales bacterium]
MSNVYLETKAREALAAAFGNRSRAAKLLARWAGEDQKLAEALLRPFLDTLCLLAVQRTEHRMARPDKPAPRPKAAVSPDLRGSAIEALASALTGRAQTTMSTTRPVRQPPQRGSMAHDAAVRALAGSFKPKRG